MKTIRQQSIISSGIVYFGFALGFVNTYLFTRGERGLHAGAVWADRSVHRHRQYYVLVCEPGHGVVYLQILSLL